MRVLVTGGCSFSECISPWIDTWPRHLAKNLPDYQHISIAMSSQGNGLISRRIIYQITELLKHHSPDDLLVGIMWSGPSRYEVYKSYTPAKIKEDLQENPTNFVAGSDGSWTILNHNWDDDTSKTYYKYFYDHIGGLVNTYEHILRVQWFLNLHNIKYFMSTYTDEVFPDIGKNHPSTKHLYDQIDFARFLNVKGEYEWCRDYSGLDFPTPGDNHPSSEQHKKFTKQVILPFLGVA